MVEVVTSSLFSGTKKKWRFVEWKVQCDARREGRPQYAGGSGFVIGIGHKQIQRGNPVEQSGHGQRSSSGKIIPTPKDVMRRRETGRSTVCKATGQVGEGK